MKYIGIIIVILFCSSCKKHNTELNSDTAILEELIKDKLTDFQKIHSTFPTESYAYYKLMALRHAKNADILIDNLKSKRISNDSLKLMTKEFFEGINNAKKFNKEPIYKNEYAWSTNFNLLRNRIRLAQYDLINYAWWMTFVDKLIANDINLLHREGKNGNNEIFITMSDSLDIPFHLLKQTIDNESFKALKFDWKNGCFIDDKPSDRFKGVLLYKNILGDTLVKNFNIVIK